MAYVEPMSMPELIRIRNEMKLTQEGLARLLRIDKSNLSQWENGRKKIPLAQVGLLRGHYETWQMIERRRQSTDEPTGVEVLEELVAQMPPREKKQVSEGWSHLKICAICSLSVVLGFYLLVSDPDLSGRPALGLFGAVCFCAWGSWFSGRVALRCWGAWISKPLIESSVSESI